MRLHGLAVHVDSMYMHETDARIVLSLYQSPISNIIHQVGSSLLYAVGVSVAPWEQGRKARIGHESFIMESHQPSHPSTSFQVVFATRTRRDQPL